MDDLIIHPESGHLVGIEQAPPRPNTGSGLTPEEAADQIRGKFVPEVTPPDLQHQSRFLTAVAAQLGVEPTHANLVGISKALEEEGVEFPSNEYPKMLYSRSLPDEKHNFETHIDLRNDHVGVLVNNEDEANELGTGWIDDPAKLPDRGKDDPRFGFEEPREVVGARTAEPGDHLRPHIASTPAGPARQGGPSDFDWHFPQTHQSLPQDIAGGTSVSAGGRGRVTSEPVTVIGPITPGVWDRHRKYIANRDGSVDPVRTNAERAKRNLETPWTHEIGVRELNEPPVD